ncbi:Crp/Fnr family transcriptional regulator [uncultured Enterovirga sp.]|uniref:Crp/Fnr family transcriptional regulator n=1 Tax=uncultured Enterovirga sp. TaxID=2026352 RepID=UPI0035C9E692
MDELVTGRRRTYGPRDVIVEDGSELQEIRLVISGLAARSKDLSDGSRQIMAFLVPGDLCDIEGFVLRAMDHRITAVSETTCALIPAAEIESLLIEFSSLTRALWWSTMTDSAVLRARIIDHGRRDARERIAHLFYEMLIRYRVVGRTTDHTFPFPVTQEELADATGMTPVHLGRILGELRDEGLLEWRRRVLTVHDPAGLKRVARFEADYLHLDRTEARDGNVAERAGDLI